MLQILKGLPDAAMPAVDPDSKEGLRRRVRKAHFTEMRLQREIESLREIIAQRDAELRTLRAAMQSPALPPDLLGLPPTQRAVLSALFARPDGMTTEALLRAGKTTASSLKVHICHVRRTLKRLNSLADIESEWGQGYRLNVQARRVVQDALAEGQPMTSGV